MTSSLVWANLVAYSVQVLVLVAVGGLLPLLLRIHQPRTQLLYLRLVLAGSLLLPALQPWRRPVVALTTLPAAAAAPAAPAANSSPVRPQIRWEEVGLGVVCAGAALRMLWLLVGMYRLRRLRTSSVPLELLPDAVEAARLRTGVEASVRVSEDAGGPVTFGAWRPVVLFPPALLEQPSEAQFGIACHEFLHVRRRDWLFTVVEEFAGALVWFHPAVWWLLGQIHLAREQVVDREVVSITETHEPYVQALLAMGGARPQLDLAPATLFLRKRHLASRVHSLLKEVTMSRGRLISSYVLTAAVVLAAAWFATASFPLEATPMVGMQEGAPPQNHVSVMVSGYAEPVLSRMRERLAGFQGRAYTVGLREEILGAAREVDPSARIPMMLQEELENGSLLTMFMVGERQVPFPPTGPVHIDVSRLPEPLRSTTQSGLAAFEGQQYTPDLRNQVTRVLSELDSQARWALIPQRQPEDGSLGMTLWIVLTEDGARLGSGVGPGLGSGFPPSGRPRIPVAGFVQAVKLIQSSPPEYPPLARQARIQGTVRFNAVIGVDGRVANLTLVSGHPLLVPPAQAVARDYVYKPTLLNGEPVEVVTQIDVNFSLQ